jgi:hypothetical protein
MSGERDIEHEDESVRDGGQWTPESSRREVRTWRAEFCPKSRAVTTSNLEGVVRRTSYRLSLPTRRHKPPTSASKHCSFTHRWAINAAAAPVITHLSLTHSSAAPVATVLFC